MSTRTESAQVWREKLVWYTAMFFQYILIDLKSWLQLLFFSLALRDASQQSRGPLGVNGGSAAWSFLWWWEHVHAARHGASKHGRLEEAVPSSASTAAAAAAGGDGRPKTRVNCGKVRVLV